MQDHQNLAMQELPPMLPEEKALEAGIEETSQPLPQTQEDGGDKESVGAK